MFFYPSDISHFYSFGCPLGSQLGSLRGKCDPDRRTQNSYKSCLWFLPIRIFPCSFLWLSLWGLNLGPCSKSANLTGARKIHIKVAYVFLPIRHFPFSFLWLSLGVPIWILAAKVCSWQARAKLTQESFMFFYPWDIFHFHSFGCTLGSPFGSLQQKCDPDRRAQNSHKSRLCFLPIRHFPSSILWLSLGVSIWIVAAKVWSRQVRAKIT